jgi:DNA-binding response OmpR family regulator
MIAIISSVKSERAALLALCEGRRWNTLEGDSVRTATRLLQRSPPKALVVRHQLSDGFSDHVLTTIANSGLRGRIRCIVLVPAGTPASDEIRQIELGADCVLRDPLRTGVLLALLEKFERDAILTTGALRPASDDTLAFAGGSLHCPSRTLTHRQRSRALTPREVELIEALTRSPGQVVRYETLYSEILGRPFRGDTSNMRVLLRKLTASAATLGLPVRDWIEVIAKAGYRYTPPRLGRRPAKMPGAR